MSLRGRRHGGGRKNELVFLTTCGPATTFDPKITGPNGTWFFDDGTTIYAASGAEISKTFAAEGLHRAVYRPTSGGLAAITRIDADTDLISSITNIEKTRVNRISLYSNASMAFNVDKIPYCTFMTFAVCGASVICNISALNRASTWVELPGNSVYGSLSDLPSTVQSAFLYSTKGYIIADSIAHLVNIRDIRIYSMGWLTADVDTVIDSMWTARAKYTYATPALQIGGTNQAPTGNVTAPVEGTDWHQDGATWIPLTAGAKIYDLAHNVNGEVRTAAWTITYTGGSIVPPVRLLGQVVGTGELSWDASGGGWDAKTDAQKFAATAGTLYYFWIKVDGDVNIKAAIYDDNAGAVGNLLGSTGAQLCHVGWNRIAFSAPVVLSATNYWLAWKMDGGYIRNVTGAGPTVSCCDSNYSAAFPEPWTHESSVVRSWAVSGWGYI